MNEDFLNLRLGVALKAAIARAAQDEERTASAQARLILREWLEQHGYVEREGQHRRGIKERSK